MDYKIVRAFDEDQAKVYDFLRDHFDYDMPLAAMFGVEFQPPCPGFNTPLSETEDIYLKAVDNTGVMIGVAINKVDGEHNVTEETPPGVKKLVEFWNFIDDKAEWDNLSSTYGNKVIDLWYIAVRREWRNRGVARALAEESMKLAREAGFRAMTIGCASEFTAKLARRLGYREIYRLAYKDYPRISGTDFCQEPTPPHEYYYYYVTEL